MEVDFPGAGDVNVRVKWEGDQIREALKNAPGALDRLDWTQMNKYSCGSSKNLLNRNRSVQPLNLACAGLIHFNGILIGAWKRKAQAGMFLTTDPRKKQILDSRCGYA